MDGYDRRNEWYLLYGTLGQILDGGGTRKLKVLLVGLISLIVSSCGLPAPLSWLNYGRTAYDANQIVKDDATTADAALSMTTGMDCQLSNVLAGKEVCEEKKKNEHDYLDADHNSDSLCVAPQ